MYTSAWFKIALAAVAGERQSSEADSLSRGRLLSPSADFSVTHYFYF